MFEAEAHSDVVVTKAGGRDLSVLVLFTPELNTVYILVF
jgi:hypothetical protein